MIRRLSKRISEIKKKVNIQNQYDILEAIILHQELSTTNFIESVDVAINLGINPRKSEQMVRGAVVLPHGVGREVYVVVFTQGENVQLAKEAGADIVGMDNLVNHIKERKYKIDVVIASPDAMNLVGTLAPILGPRGLMPNIKIGTLSNDVGSAVRHAKSGQIYYRNDKGGIIHAIIGKVNFTPEQLKENLECLIISLKQSKPSQCKGIFLKKIIISTTMGIGMEINKNSLSVVI